MTGVYVRAREDQIFLTGRKATMKRIMIAALAILMLVAVSVGGVLPAFAEGAHDHVHATATADTVDAPKVGATSTQPIGADLSGYKGTPKPANAKAINNVMDFLTMEADGTYYLATDLVLNTSYSQTFTGKLYGTGKTVTLTAPMFKMLDGAEVYDLVLEGSVVKADYAGALAEQAYIPSVTGVINNADVTSTNNGYTGGLIGAVWNKPGEVSFRYCVNNGYIDNASMGTGKTDAGGIAGIVRGTTTGETKDKVWTRLVTKYDKLTVEHCVNNGTIYGSNRTGGIIGVMGENTWIFGTIRVTNCTNNGDVTSTQHYVGGLTARLSGLDSVFANCLNTGDVAAPAASKYGGGIVGLAEDPEAKTVMTNCRNEGNVTTTVQAGGILGWANKVGISPDTGFSTADTANAASVNPSSYYFYDCVNVGVITGGSNAAGLGLISNADEVVAERCENHGEIIGKDNGGGMFIQIGANKSLIKDCYNSAPVAASDAGGMIGEITYNNSQITFRNCVNDGTITGGRPGGILGCNDSKSIKAQFIDCVNNAKVHSTSNYGGGIAGRMDARVANGTVTGFESTAAVLFLRCVNNGEMETFKSQGGGIVGYVDGNHADGTGGAAVIYSIEFRDCTNNAYVHPTDLTKDVSVGGIGGNVDAKVTASGLLNTGEIKSGNARTGGLFGIIWQGPSTITNSVNTGNVTTNGSTTSDVGGIVGLLNHTGTINNCINTGNITGNYRVGGIAGYMGASGSITTSVNYCVNTGNVTSAATVINERSQTTGGIVGYIYGAVGSISYNASLGNVTANYNNDMNDGNEMIVGALVGYQNHSVGDYKYNYFTGKITAGTGLAVMMKNTPGDKLDSYVGSKYVGNFSVISYPLYYHRASTGPDTWAPADTTTSPITADTSSATFLSTLNTAAGAGTFVMVTTCEGESFPVHKDTATAFELTRTHSDADHDYYTINKKDSTYHWAECSVCGAISPEGKVAHFGGTATCIDPAKCTVCSAYYGEIDENNHLDPITWSKDANGHSAVTSCCERTIDSVAHTFENGVCTVCQYACLHDPDHEDSTAANCQSLAYCGVCQMTYGTTADHIFDRDAWVEGDALDTHYNPCKLCDAYDADSAQACYGGTATCTAPAVCEACSNTYGDLDPEVHSTTESYYVQDADDLSKCNLLHACCDALIDSVDHVQGTVATCQSGAICDNCGGEYGVRDYSNHTGTEMTYAVNANDNTKHDAFHTCCGYPEAPAAHTGGNATCKDPAACALCGAAYGEPSGEHAYDDPCTDQFCNDCGTERTGMEHKFGEWKVTKAATDTADGEQERVCEHCGKTQTVTIAAGTNVNSALDNINTDAKGSDAYIGVIVIAVAGALVLALVIAFVVHKRNKRK